MRRSQIAIEPAAAPDVSLPAISFGGLRTPAPSRGVHAAVRHGAGIRAPTEDAEHGIDAT